MTTNYIREWESRKTPGLISIAEEEGFRSFHDHEYRDKFDDSEFTAQQCHPFYNQGMGRHLRYRKGAAHFDIPNR